MTYRRGARTHPMRAQSLLVALVLSATVFLGYVAHVMQFESEGSDFAPNLAKLSLLRTALDSAFDPFQQPTRGIILCLNNDILPLGVSLIQELRCLDNWEPIEVYHCSELSGYSQQLILSIDDNVRVIDICAQLVDQNRFLKPMQHKFRSFWIKPLAVHETKLSEVILMDADVVLLKNPALLRNVPGYKQNGTVFFHDRVLPYRLFLNRYGTQKSAEFVFNASISDQEIVNSSWAHWTEPNTGEIQYLHHWLRNFNYTRFNTTYGPSQHLLESLVYASETAHEQDSSIVAIDKTRAEPAMAMLWYLITEHRFNFTFSWGDKESFWLAYEFSHTPYFFSPWGASVVSSNTNRDMKIHPETLCGSLAHFTPVSDTEPELFYVNGKALIDPVPLDPNRTDSIRPNHFFNMLPTHVTPRHKRSAVLKSDRGRFFSECLVGLGATEVPAKLRDNLWRRRIHFLAVAMNKTEALAQCYDSGV